MQRSNTHPGSTLGLGTWCGACVPCSRPHGTGRLPVGRQQQHQQGRGERGRQPGQAKIKFCLKSLIDCIYAALWSLLAPAFNYRYPFKIFYFEVYLSHFLSKFFWRACPWPSQWVGFGSSHGFPVYTMESIRDLNRRLLLQTICESRPRSQVTDPSAYGRQEVNREGILC